MALAFQSTLETLDHLYPEIGPFNEQQSEVTDALISFFSDAYEAPHFPIDSLFDPPYEQLYSQTECYVFPSSDPSMLFHPPEFYPSNVELNLYQSRKRPWSCSDLCHPSDLMYEAKNACYGTTIPAPTMASFEVQDFSTEFVAPPPSFPAPLCNGERKPSSGCLSAQSVAARERRRRISEKTQELGRLIPGGHKMNTAEMFQAAYKYVKFLPAQIAILKLMDSIQDRKASPQVYERLQSLLASTATQEKLYGEGKCVAHEEIVENMRKDQENKSNPFISRDLDRLIELMG